LIAVAAVGALCFTGVASAGSISAWNDDNVKTTVTDVFGGGASVIYDRAKDEPGAVSHGQIIFDGLEAVAPGLKIENNAPPSDPPTQGNVDNCLMASSPASCNSERQSGKRFKINQTATGAIDLLFDHDPTGGGFVAPNDGLYKVFQKYGNDTGGRLTAFTVTLGTGVGAGFVPSGIDDGLRFVDFGADPKNSEFSALFANGLFGPAGEEHPLSGYFSPERAGFNLSLTGQDSFQSGSLFGAYAPLFGDWMAFSQAPLGYFFDEDGDASTDALLVAHQLADGSWVQNRSIAADGSVTTIAYGNDGTAFANLDSLVAALPAGLVDCTVATPGTPCVAGLGEVEDLAKFNLTFSIDPTAYRGEQFTLRVSAVPEPSTYALMALGLAAVGFSARRRRSNA
jgi:hypothetical protein